MLRHFRQANHVGCFSCCAPATYIQTVVYDKDMIAI